MMDTQIDLEYAAPWLVRKPRLPGAVSVLWCQPTRAGGLMFAWQPPAGRTRVETYRIERTSNGREYEWIADTTEQGIAVSPLGFDDGWFYRVTACNSRGQGPARWVHYYLRRHRDSILQRVPVKPGLRVNICELIPS